MKKFVMIALVGALCGCSAVQQGVMFTANDTASAQAIATAAGMPGDAQCWGDFNAVLSAAAQQLGEGNGGIASTLALQRANKALAARPECAGIVIELLAALSAIPKAGPIAIGVLGF